MLSLHILRSAGELEARRAATQAARGEAVPELRAVPEETGSPPSHAQEALRSPGQPLDDRTRADLEPRFGHDFSRVRVHAEGSAARSASMLRARAYTFGQDIVFGPGRYEPASLSGRSLIAHELAHVVQQGKAGRAAVQLASELESLPEYERTKVQVLVEPLSEKMTEDVERAYQASTLPKLPPGMTIQFGASVAKSSQEGLKAVVGVLIDGAALPSNRSLALAISAAGEIHRFTRVERSSKLAEVVVVEKTGDLGAAPAKAPGTKPVWEVFPGSYSKAHGPLPQREARQMRDCLALGADLSACQAVVPEEVLREGEVEIRKVKIKRGPGWKLSDWAAVSAALEGLPATVLNRALHVTFQREAKKACSPEAEKTRTCYPESDAETSVVFGTITLFDQAFRVSTTRQGTSTQLQSTLIHEIGHLADQVFLGNALSEYLGAPEGSRDNQKLLDTRSLSGMGWVDNVVSAEGLRLNFRDPGGIPKEDSFRAAAIRDGLVLKDGKIKSGGITDYSQTGWFELFAESYMLYFADPDLFKAIRPNLFKYFAATWPQKK
jgi:hypothetical protein